MERLNFEWGRFIEIPENSKGHNKELIGQKKKDAITD